MLTIHVGSFFTQATRIAARNYLPSNEDVLRARAKTMAITETRFSMGQLSIHMVDVGGQHSERKKWIHNFESVTSIMFCTALSEYNQVLTEEKNQVCKQIIMSQVPTNQWLQNRMAESLVLFELVINSWCVMTVRLGLSFFFSIPSPPSPYHRYLPCLVDCAPSLLSITCLTLALTVLHTHASVPADVHPLCTFHARIPHRYLMYHCTFCAHFPTP